MKANLKGLGNVKGLLLAHGEKLGIAVVGICALMFVYFSLSQEPLPEQYQASELRTKIEQADREVKEFTWASASAEDVRTASVSPQKQGDDVTVQSRFYETSKFGLDRPVIRPTVFRKDPELLAAVDVEVHSGSGLLAFDDKAIAEERARQLAVEEKEKEKERREQQQRNQDEARQGRNARNRNERDRATAPVDPKHPKRRPLSSRVPPAGVALTGAERIDPAYWAIVVAKVPIRQQLRRYRDVLANARDYEPQDDVPQYLGYRVQRAEILPGQPLKWTNLEVYDGQRVSILTGKSAWRYPGLTVTAKAWEEVTKDWAGGRSMPEVVDDRFFDPDFVLPFPLPPLVERDWGDDVTHSDIPLIVDDEGLDAVENETGAESPQEPAGADDFNPFSSTNSRPEGRSGRSMSPRGMGRGDIGYRRGGMPLEGGRGFGRGTFDSRMMGRGSMGSRNAGGVPAKDVSYWLLRFFDFSVQPGKKYKYRVQLVLADVNNTNPSAAVRMVDKDALDSTVHARISKEAEEAKKIGKTPQPIRRTEWSEPSMTVGIPLSGDVLVAGVKAPSDALANDEPRLTLLVSSFGVGNENQAIQAAKEEDGFRRGSVANMSEDVEVLVEYGLFIDEQKDFNFRTGITVVDIRGGEKLSKDLFTPAQALLMDPTGQLYVRSEVKDFDEVNHHRLLFAKPEKGARGYDSRQEFGIPPGRERGGR